MLIIFPLIIYYSGSSKLGLLLFDFKIFLHNSVKKDLAEIFARLLIFLTNFSVVRTLISILLVFFGKLFVFF